MIKVKNCQLILMMEKIINISEKTYFELHFHLDFKLRIKKIRNCSILNLKKVWLLIVFDFGFGLNFGIDFTSELQLLLHTN